MIYLTELYISSSGAESVNYFVCTPSEYVAQYMKININNEIMLFME
jgi:hypothetical protein